jgi:anti-sigma regulatory factor (Ser/Thr protein kinase)
MFTLKAEDWMLIEKEFGAQKGDYIEMSLTSMDEVIGMSETVIDFCINKGISPKESMLAGLAIEEMAGNIVQHGFVPGKKHLIEVRVVKKENLIIRIKDNCREFDPKKRIEQFYPEDICKNIGIRMVAGIAKSMEYQNNIGINTLLITI